ncbi:MAG TPA: penicillin acylase family protein [Thermoleophilaceae bacterium]|nr:penicillin acylase family protein [Thermoleophilaceae bacterium]
MGAKGQQQRHRRTRAGALVLALVLLALTAPAAQAAKGGPRADVRRSAHGIPHIVAKSWEGIGYGYGYAFAQDNICPMADNYVTVRAERSRFFGPDGSYASRGNGTEPNNLNSDFFFKRAMDTKVVEKLIARKPPQGPLPVVNQTVRGYVRGYNQYLEDTGRNNISDPACRGKPWVRKISVLDAYRRFWQLGLLASQGVAIDGIGAAAPPFALPKGSTPAGQPSAAMLDEFGSRLTDLGIGSNAVGLGSAGTKNGKGVVLGNPHFPWDGTERFYEAHATIPGKVNVIGGSLFGVPAVLIGHTNGLAWSHTVSTAFRFTPFELKLVPGSPTTYLYNGQPREMKRDNVTVQVRQGDGSLKPQSRTLYSSHQGPILTSILGLPIFPWTVERAYAIGDANAGNFRYLNHFFEVDTSQTVDQLDRVERKYQGIPWVNTIAADKNGKAYYADIGSIPNVPDTKVDQCVNGVLGKAVYAAVPGLPVLDGSTSSCEWSKDADAVAPGIFGPKHLPSLFRRDYTENSNDSYWLSNPHKPLTGFARIIGNENAARSLRTRNGLTMIERRLHGKDGRKGRGFDLKDMTWMVFNDRQYAGVLWKDALVDMCKADGTEPSKGGTVDVSAACPVLAKFDNFDNLDSRGAILFRRFVENVRSSVAPVGLPTSSQIYTTQFDASDPVNTPRGLNTSSPQVKQALGDAVNDLRSNGIPLDATLRTYQYEQRGKERIPIHGGPGGDSLFNAINVSWDPPGGYTDIPHGSSFVMVTQFQKRGCPKNRAILTYSLSTNPKSPYYSDQTRMFSRKKWVDPPFCPSQVRKRSKLTMRLGPNGRIRP